MGRRRPTGSGRGDLNATAHARARCPHAAENVKTRALVSSSDRE